MGEQTDFATEPATVRISLPLTAADERCRQFMALGAERARRRRLLDAMRGEAVQR
jgi:hypothetical protein